MSIRLVQQFLKLESSSGVILFISAVLSMIWANSSFALFHQALKSHYLFEINDGLMTFFFLLVGLELKRGFIEGPLSQLSQVVAPAIAALGGMVVPALIYLMVNVGHPDALRGWATPVATDIAFALGVLSLFGRRVPSALKLFLLALAIFDDVGAILIIAFGYSQGVSFLWLSVVFGLLILLISLNKWKVQRLTTYLIVGFLLWLSVFYAGLHPTIAGVLLALMIPATAEHTNSPLHRLEKYLHPWVAYFIMPLFALANTGFPLVDMQFSFLFDGVVLGIVLGLFIGKQIGVFGVTWLLVKSGFAKLPKQTSWLSLYGVSLLCGIGFTMSLFLGTLSFSNELYLSEVRMGVILASVLSGLTGAGILRIALNRKLRSQAHAK